MDKIKTYRYAIGLFIVLVAVSGTIIFNRIVQAPKYDKDGLAIKMETEPGNPRVGETTKIKFSLEDKYGYAPTLYLNHSRRLHVVIVGEDMNVFGHIHPEDFGPLTEESLYGGDYELEFNFPKAGKYVIALDGKTDEGEIHRRFSLSVDGRDEMRLVEPDLRTEKCFKGHPENGEDRIINPIFSDESEVDCGEGYSVKISLEPKEVRSGEPVKINYHIEKNGEYVRDLEPYLNAGAHFIVVSNDGKIVMHAHGGPVEMKMDHSYLRLIPAAYAHGLGADDEEVPMEPQMFGPHILSEEIVFPKEGTYYVFGQFKHQGKIVFTKFAIKVAGGENPVTEGAEMK